MAKLLGNLLWIQEKLLEQNPDTKSILHPETESSKSTAHGSDEEEEIPSDTEDEKSDGDDDAEDEEDRTNGEQAESSLKLPAKRKHELVSCRDFVCYTSAPYVNLIYAHPHGRTAVQITAHCSASQLLYVYVIICRQGTFSCTTCSITCEH